MSPSRLDDAKPLTASCGVSDAPPPKVQEYADQAVAYVQRSLHMTLEYDSDTLPILDHYLRSVPSDQSAATELIVLTAGAYFGEVVRRRLGGRWQLADEPNRWRVVLPTGLSFAPAGLAASAIVKDELADLDTEVEVPPRLRHHVQQAAERMATMSEDAYYSLCGRLDAIEHLHEVLVTVASQLLGDEDVTRAETEQDEPPTDPQGELPEQVAELLRRPGDDHLN
jgi:hypothetical protein